MSAKPSSLRHRLDRLGGLVTVAELAEHWGISKTVAATKVRAPNFPSPVAVLPDSQRLWLLAECEEWNQTPYRARRRRSGVQPFQQPQG